MKTPSFQQWKDQSFFKKKKKKGAYSLLKKFRNHTQYGVYEKKIFLPTQKKNPSNSLSIMSIICSFSLLSLPSLFLFILPSLLYFSLLFFLSLFHLQSFLTISKMFFLFCPFLAFLLALLIDFFLKF